MRDAPLAGCGEGVSGCCKECTDSKPCGDSCIPKSSTCTKGSGCACSTAQAAAEDPEE